MNCQEFTFTLTNYSFRILNIFGIFTRQLFAADQEIQSRFSRKRRIKHAIYRNALVRSSVHLALSACMKIDATEEAARRRRREKLILS